MQLVNARRTCPLQPGGLNQDRRGRSARGVAVCWGCSSTAVTSVGQGCQSLQKPLLIGSEALEICSAGVEPVEMTSQALVNCNQMHNLIEGAALA